MIHPQVPGERVHVPAEGRPVASRITVVNRLDELMPEEGERIRQGERDRIAVTVGHQIIKRIFSVSLELRSCSTLVDPSAAQRFESVVSQLDDLIVTVRRVVFDLQVDGEPPPESGVDGGADPVAELQERARVVLTTADESLGHLLNDAVANGGVYNGVAARISDASRLLGIAEKSIVTRPMS